MAVHHVVMVLLAMRGPHHGAILVSLASLFECIVRCHVFSIILLLLLNLLLLLLMLYHGLGLVMLLVGVGIFLG